MQFTLDEAKKVLKQFWNYDEFRRAQVPVLEAIANGEDVLAVLPTGVGKSLLYQVPATLLEGCVLVVSPLIALMKDQVDDLVKVGVPASFVNSHTDEDEANERLGNLSSGAYKLFYVSPERLKSRTFRDVLINTHISIIAIDESHCASQWGHSFRPSYMRIHEIVDLLSKPCSRCNGTGKYAGGDLCGCHEGKERPQIVAVTATATGDIEDDIAKALGMDQGYTRIVADPIRPNFDYIVIYDNEPFRALRQRVRDWDLVNGRYVIYGGTRKLCEILCKSVAEQIGMSKLSSGERGGDWKRMMAAAYERGRDYVAFYHAGMKRDDSTAVDEEDGRRVFVAGRESVQDSFKNGKTPVVIATCAFGMGIDVPNIREVLHFGIPGCLEDYVQQSGRGGRDGLPTNAVLLHNDKSVEIYQRFMDLENPPYELYPVVWMWLHTKLQPGQLLRMSAAKIADAISGRERVEAVASRMGGQNVSESEMQFVRDVEIYAGQVNTILNAMESCGLVRRIPAADGTEMSINVSALRAVATGDGDDLPEGAKALAEYLWHSEVAPRVQQFPIKRMDLTVDKDDLANAMNRSLSTVNRQLATLTAEKIVIVAPTFTGNTTEIRQYGAALDEYLPVDQIEAKRAREQARLDKMLQYATCDDRRTYLRDYFLKGVGAIPDA